MARYLLEQEEQSLERLKAFNSAGYYYSEAESSPRSPVFLREEQSWYPFPLYKDKKAVHYWTAFGF